MVRLLRRDADRHCGPTGIELFSGTIEDGNYEFVEFDFADDAEFMDYVNGFRARPTFVSAVEVQPTDRIIGLCTCTYEKQNAGYLLLGRLVPLYNEGRRLRTFPSHKEKRCCYRAA